jgi:hypothetical protein
MHAISKLVSLLLLGGSLALPACENVTVDTTGGLTPPAGVIRGTVNYVGPPPCSQNGHIVGSAVVLVFGTNNPPPPSGLANTAVNFGVVAGDVLFHDWPVTQGAEKVCPDANAPTQSVSASYAISPMSAGQYVVQGFYDYTGDFFATFKFRNLPEATDVGGGYIQLSGDGGATQLVPSDNSEDAGGGVSYYPLIENQSDPNYLPVFLPINVGTQGATSSTSLRSVPTFTMPETGYLADNVTVTLALTLNLARPYFYPEGVNSTSLSGSTPEQPISPIVYGGLSSTRPPTSLSSKTPQNPTGNGDFIPVVSFPQDIQIYAQPTLQGLLGNLPKAPQIFDQYQAALPSVVLHAGVPLPEQNVAADIANAADPFHMQLGLSTPLSSGYTAAPGGNGGIYVWWDAEKPTACGNEAACDGSHLDFIPEAPGNVYRMWPLIVLAKLNDLPAGASQPNPNDPEEIAAQGADLTKPIVIIQGITLYQDKFLYTANATPITGLLNPPSAPDLAGNTNLYDHVTFLVRPSTLCMDPRAPDHGGVLVTTGKINSAGTILGSFTALDTKEPGQPVVIDSHNLTNPQLAQLVNHTAAGSTNGLVGGCLPLGRYEINMVYPTGQAWTTPNEVGSCAAAEGNTVFSGTGASFTDAPGGCSAVSPRPVLYSQGTRAIVEITPATNPANCAAFSATGTAPVDPTGKPTADGSPFACSGLCSDPSLDPTTKVPCSQCLDPQYDPTTNPPCTNLLANPPPLVDAGP